MANEKMTKKLKPGQTDDDRERFDLRLSIALRRRLKQQAERFGLKLSPYIRQALIKQLEADEKNDPESSQ